MPMHVEAGHTTGKAGRSAGIRSVRSVAFGVRALGIGLFLVVGVGLVLGWSSRRHRSPGAQTPDEADVGRIEGGI
jgi:hypothetical protein